MNKGNIHLIHIGKCGGSSVRSELIKKNFNFTCFHSQKVKYDKNANYIIVIRNPIQRFISAFNWRCNLVCLEKSQKTRFNNEYNLLNKYKNIDTLCRDLKDNPNIFNGDFNSNNYIHHLKEDIHFHLEDIIDKCSKSQIVCVVLTETIKEDLKTYFGIESSIHEKNNCKFHKKITDENYKILKNYLKKDYEVVEKMFLKGWIDEEKYDILRK